MFEVVSLVNFDNPKRIAYLERSFGSFYRHNTNVRHIVFDSSRTLGEQAAIYQRYGLEVVHQPGTAYGARLKTAMQMVTQDYFLFLPDDFEWILKFPVAEAMQECGKFGIAELKLTCRGMSWFSKDGSGGQPWFTRELRDGKQVFSVASGETLSSEGNLAVSRRRWIRDFHEQFSLACNVLQTEFARWVIGKISARAKSPSAAEKQAYLWLVLRRYATAYYKMWIPAFHFIDLAVEGDTVKNRERADTMLVASNIELYNRLYNI